MNNMDKLKQELASVALNSSEFKNALKEASEEITNQATSATNEATIEGVFERVIYATLRDIGIKFHPEKEAFVETRRHTGKGRMDSRIGSVVIEFKHRSKLKSEIDILAAQKQLTEYILSISKQLNNEVIGFLTDGLVLYEIRAVDGNVYSVSGKSNINEDVLLRLIKSIVLLEKSALISKNLIKDFCGNSYEGVLFDLARVLNKILISRSTPKTDMLRAEWEESFRLAHEDQSQQKRIQERRIVLSEVFKEPLENASSEYRTLFALDTAYAIVLKFIAYRVVSDVRFGVSFRDFKSLISTDNQMLRPICSDLEDGEIFRQLGILNLLEGDFFSWYSDENQWNNELSYSLQFIIEILARYEDVSHIFSSNNTTDLFRELYESTVPQIVRSSFGEVYTPLWLAQHVLESSSLSENCRILDPCCGSGTFLIAAISHIREEKKEFSDSDILNDVLSRVVGIDLNPLAVLTARIHYFINIANLIPQNCDSLVIPVFLGDASYVPEEVDVAGIKCLKYQLKTLKDPINIEIPLSIVEQTDKFVPLMYKYENYIKNENAESATELLLDALSVNQKIPEIEERIVYLTDQLISLEKKKWNGIWARIITNFMTTACLNKFSNIVGNPPWIDWKNLPEGYRNRIKSLCIDKGLFSGSGRTGGINLNICALITHVATTNWLSENGKLSFLMPRELAYQPSYEGWRSSVGGINRSILHFDDWSKAGHPFHPVTEDFMTYVIGKKEELSNVIPVICYIKKKGNKTKAHQWVDIEEAKRNLDQIEKVAGQIIPGKTAYTITKNEIRLHDLSQITGECYYIGREGIEFYPQELLLFKYDGPGPKPGTVFLRNIQVQKSKYKIPNQRVLLETKHLYPLVKGPALEPFYYNYENIIVPFPYDNGCSRKPIDAKKLQEESPLLFAYYKKYQQIINAQTKFSDKIRGPDAGDFYGLARTGPYSFQNVYVSFRDNTKWRAAVITSIGMPWGENKRFVFQNHAVSICERKTRNEYITEEEAHYICAIFNAPIVEEFINDSSDTRSFKVRPPVFVPLYDSNNPTHKKLAELSRKVHESKEDMKNIIQEIEELYLNICAKK